VGFSGTSASAPVVAGVYALLLSAKPGLTPAALDDILFTTAVDLGAKGQDQEFGHGRVDAAAAVQKALGTSTADTQAPQVAIITPGNNQTVSGLVAVDALAQDNLGVTKVELYAKNTLVATDSGAPYAFTLDTSPYGDGPLALFTKAYDAAGNVGTSSTVTVTVGNDTVPPTVQILNPPNGSTVSGTFNISVSASDDKQVAKIVLKIDGKEVANAYGSTLSYSTTAPTAEATGSKGKGGGGGGGGGKGNNKTTSSSTGSMNISAEAFDAAGNSKSTTVTVYY
jgi:thermitase